MKKRKKCTKIWIVITAIIVGALGVVCWFWASTHKFYQYSNQELGFSIQIPTSAWWTDFSNGPWSEMPLSVVIESQSATSSTAYIDYRSYKNENISSYIKQYMADQSTTTPPTFLGPGPFTIEIDKVDNQQEVATMLSAEYEGCSTTFKMSPTKQQGVFYVGMQTSDTIVPTGQVLGEYMLNTNATAPCGSAPVAEYYPEKKLLAIITYPLQYCPFEVSPDHTGYGINGFDLVQCYSPQIAHSFRFIQK